MPEQSPEQSTITWRQGAAIVLTVIVVTAMLLFLTDRDPTEFMDSANWSAAQLHTTQQ